ncbi:Pentatricopeptide repeat-containing protein [Hibiscus syriacus]|uniref:Pentatricopeptide repeat-containing protein n=1 Tax=Hibiscus syriacus TaxID=106335 RepID=A0A6A2YE29_HIBSY|nr:pentatricopeptide repeat-containing protein At5g61370, mitochondrial-like [Hibiscus syriacus]KAE8670794.1 Pentatricopeptide repeat-containing protein [Hibiscus syriacus]
MPFLIPPVRHRFLTQIINIQKPKNILHSLYSSSTTSPEVEELCKVVSSSIGGLDDLESSLNGLRLSLSSSLVNEVIKHCENVAPSRRLLRFFLWSVKNFSLEDKDFNHAVRVFAKKKDHTAMEILVSDLRNEGRPMESQTFSVVADMLVKLGREDEALGIFKNLEKFNCTRDSFSVTAIVNALCAKGHAKKAEGVVYHHKDKIAGVEPCIYRSLLFGWCVQENVKEARRVIKEMKSAGIELDSYCYNTFIRCLCGANVKRNPSGLVPETLNVMMEMRSHRIAPTSVSYNILLSSLGKTRRVKESCRILDLMQKTGCAPDWITYYLVVRVLYLTGRFGKGNMIVDEMIESGLTPDCNFYYDLIGVLCGVERVNFAVELFEKMKRSSLGGHGPVYDVLIPKLCRGGEFEKGRELWDEAVASGVGVTFSSDVLHPSVTEVFKPTREVKEFNLKECKMAKNSVNMKQNNFKGKKGKKIKSNKKKYVSK